MNPDQMLAHFDRISEAPDAIPRLRRFILDLAVWGKLVEQDPNDEPAAELLSLLESSPRGIPSNWIAENVGKLLDFQYGKGLPASERLDKGRVCVFGSNGIVGYCTEALTEEAAIIIGRKGSAGALNLCMGPSWTTDVAYFVNPPAFFDIHFLLIALQTLDLGNLGKGVKPGLSRKDAYELDIVVPPLAEQHRIVAKVDELMALCDQFEAAKAERESQRDRLIAASLHHLNSSADTDASREQARFYLKHLPRFTTRPQHIKQLRQTILNLAVRGRLVPQDPNDELISNLENTSANNIEWSHQLPFNWQWRRLQEIADLITDGEHATPTRISEQQVPLITAKNVRDGIMDYAITDWVSYETAEKAWRRCRPLVSDILLVCVGATTGRLCVLRESKDMVLVRSVTLIRPSEIVDTDYLELAIRSPLGQEQIWSNVKATAQPCLYINRTNALVIPIPPLAEQHRIVAKVAELMALCDQLETQLTATQADSRRLLEAVLHQTLEEQHDPVPVA